MHNKRKAIFQKIWLFLRSLCIISAFAEVLRCLQKSVFWFFTHSSILSFFLEWIFQQQCVIFRSSHYLFFLVISRRFSSCFIFLPGVFWFSYHECRCNCYHYKCCLRILQSFHIHIQQSFYISTAIFQPRLRCCLAKAKFSEKVPYPTWQKGV